MAAKDLVSDIAWLPTARYQPWSHQCYKTFPSKGKLSVTAMILTLSNNDGYYSLLTTEARLTLGKSLDEGETVYIKVTNLWAWL